MSATRPIISDAAAANPLRRRAVRAKNLFSALTSVVILLTASGASATCPAGKISCASWCAKYRPGTQDCMSGHTNSCEAKPGGAAACVGDICNAQNDSCKRLQEQEVRRMQKSKT